MLYVHGDIIYGTNHTKLNVSENACRTETGMGVPLLLFLPYNSVNTLKCYFKIVKIDSLTYFSCRERLSGNQISEEESNKLHSNCYQHVYTVPVPFVCSHLMLKREVAAS